MMQPTAPCSAATFSDAAPRPAVTRNDDLAFDVDAVALRLVS
jgi:hypothetical protein